METLLTLNPTASLAKGLGRMRHSVQLQLLLAEEGELGLLGSGFVGHRPGPKNRTSQTSC